MIFQSPLFLILIPIVIGILFYPGLKKQKPAIRFSSKEFLSGLKPSGRIKLRKYLIHLRVLSLILFIIALSKPVSPTEETEIEREGIDIVFALDVSTSMLAEDFEIGKLRVNRLDVVKDVTENFVRKREDDRMGMVVFASRAYTVCPLTLDKNWLIKNIGRVDIGMVGDGTAIGSGLSSALNRLRETKAKSKIIVLLTDGMNNAGKVNPLTAAEAAKALGVKIYTIGAGSKGPVPYPVRNVYGGVTYEYVKIDIDEDTLKNIASITGGLYFRATDTENLRNIYKEIDKLETYPMEEKGYMKYEELFPMFLMPGLIILLLGVILDNTILRSAP